MRSQCRRGRTRLGECYDNALPGMTQAESLWSRLKTEVLELREWPVFADLADAQTSIADYFDYYNHDRLHFSITGPPHIYSLRSELRIKA